MINDNETTQEYYARRYQEGKNILDNGAIEFHIAVDGTWSTSGITNLGHQFSCASYEKIGFHIGSSDFFKGVQESGIKISDHRKV